MFVQHNIFDKVKFIDGIDKNGTCVLLHSFMTTVAIPLNDVFVAYILGYMGNLTYFCLQFNEDNLNTNVE